MESVTQQMVRIEGILSKSSARWHPKIVADHTIASSLSTGLLPHRQFLVGLSFPFAACEYSMRQLCPNTSCALTVVRDPM